MSTVTTAFPDEPERPNLRVAGPDDVADVLSAAPKRPARIRTSWTAADIMAMEFSPPKWAVPGVHPRAGWPDRQGHQG